MLKYVADRHPKVRLEVVNVTFPCPHSKVVEDTETLLEKYNKPSASIQLESELKPVGKDKKERVRLVLMDSISSNPG